MSQGHRVSTPRGEKGGGRRFFSQIEPNWPLPYSTVPLPLLRDAKPAGWVTYCSICVSTMLTAQNRAAKCSILLQRRFALPILLYLFFLSMVRGQGRAQDISWGRGAPEFCIRPDTQYRYFFRAQIHTMDGSDSFFLSLISQDFFFNICDRFVGNVPENLSGLFFCPWIPDLDLDPNRAWCGPGSGSA